MQNYFNYFTEIEEHFQRRRGTALLLSTLDWVLIETWKDAGIPLEAALRGIDVAFEKFERRPQTFRKVNSLAYCAQAVMQEAEQMKEAAVGGDAAQAERAADAGLDSNTVADYLRRNATDLASKAGVLPAMATAVANDSAAALQELASAAAQRTMGMEDLEQIQGEIMKGLS